MFIVEKHGVYRDFNYLVIFMRDGHRCGYVGIPENHILYKKHYDECQNIDCHGGLTFSDFTSKFPCNDLHLWWLGFDCNHYVDLRDYDSIEKYYGKKTRDEIETLYHSFNTPGQHLWTLDECETECKSIIDQIIRFYRNED